MSTDSRANGSSGPRERCTLAEGVANTTSKRLEGARPAMERELASAGQRRSGKHARYRTGVSIASRLSSSQKSMNSPRMAAIAESAGMPTVMCSEYMGAPVCGAV